MLTEFNKLSNKIISEASTEWAGGDAAFPEMLKTITLDKFPDFDIKVTFDPERSFTTFMFYRYGKLFGTKAVAEWLPKEKLEEVATEYLIGKLGDEYLGRYLVKDLIADLESNPRYVVKYMPTKNLWRIKYAGREFYNQYDRNKICPGWALWNEIKKIWEANSSEKFDDVRTNVYSEYFTISE
jgi:hypothetical protein